MKVLVVGSGGREHAIAWKLKKDGTAVKIYSAPGNAGIQSVAECVAIKADDITGIGKFAYSKKIDLVIVGPEVPLCMGLADLLGQAGIPVFGPDSKAARIEGSKSFAKNLMKKYGIPTAEYCSFDNFGDAVKYARTIDSDMWIKASGLAAGKGAVYAENPDEAEKTIKNMLVDSVFGESGNEIVIEENMSGEEASIFAICDGKNYKLLLSSQDHKRAFDGDKGPNTGGMGAYAPAPLVTEKLLGEVETQIIRPTLDGMIREGCPYKGVLYAGIMATDKGPKVVEFNCRFGDPETQAVLPLLETDLFEMMMASAKGQLDRVSVNPGQGYAICVVMASGGYPDSYSKGYEIKGLGEAGEIPGVVVFHAGSKNDGDRILTSGGRVLGVVGTGQDFPGARTRAYEACDLISFEKSFYRGDIGYRAMKYFRK